MGEGDNPMQPVRGPVGNVLKGGTIGGDPTSSPRCGARTRAGTACLGPALKGKRRCRMHGGASSGPKSPHAKHGGYSKALQQALRQARALLRGAGAAVAEAPGTTAKDAAR